MAFTIGDLFLSVPTLMAGRPFTTGDIAEAARKAILELTEDYKFPQLQATGPVVHLIPGQTFYPLNYFLAVGGDQGLEINKVNSFYFYYNTYAPLTNPNGSNTGYNLRFATIETLETLLNIPGIPSFWSRFGDQICIAMSPNQAFALFMRYQKEHPFPNKNSVNAGLDPVLMPNSWQDIVEYATAMRLANNTRLYDIAGAMKTALYGDPLFQRTGGTEGSPGLIFHRTSQEQRDQTTSTKSLRLVMHRIMR